VAAWGGAGPVAGAPAATDAVPGVGAPLTLRLPRRTLGLLISEVPACGGEPPRPQPPHDPVPRSYRTWPLTPPGARWRGLELTDARGRSRFNPGISTWTAGITTSRGCTRCPDGGGRRSKGGVRSDPSMHACGRCAPVLPTRTEVTGMRLPGGVVRAG
jgi:hypothetical protein